MADSGRLGPRTPGRWVYNGRAPLPAPRGRRSKARRATLSSALSCATDDRPRDNDIPHVSPSSWAGLAVFCDESSGQGVPFQRLREIQREVVGASRCDDHGHNGMSTILGVRKPDLEYLMCAGCRGDAKISTASSRLQESQNPA
ncbi:uncharacterized protein LOC117011643 isoform X2 [Rhinolophus ferrumequinum]|uniref:uncharacterized protein LOC117011643 isoform X2 n=1 Tax=Rhinolophus ferrumequinum TaxID=59479 RepID=UPI00140F5CD5|nr:uncharacterized protein LOC117011643 isoform X2 [Rhinolophus ferrumequinum]